MILRRIKVQGVRCFRNPLEIGEFGDGINMIFAPNESGKSTLVDAVARALFERHAVTGKKIEPLRPWGTQLAPEIEVDIIANGKTYRVFKRLLTDQVSRLWELTQGTPMLLAERDQADEFVRGLLLAEAPGSGATSPKHWGVARMLWCTQGMETEGGRIEIPDAVAQQLRQALPGAVFPQHSLLAEIMSRVETRFRLHFTESGKAKRAGSPLQALQERITALEQEVDQTRVAYETALTASAQIQDVERELRDLATERSDYEAKAAALEEDTRRVSALRAEVLAAQTAVTRAEEDHRISTEADTQYRDTVTQCQRAERDLQEQRQQLQDAMTGRKAAELYLRDARVESKAAQEARQLADTARQRTRKANELVRIRETREVLMAQAERVASLSSVAEELAERHAVLLCPTEEELTEIRQWREEAVELRALLAATGIRATIAMERDGEVEWQVGQDAPQRQAMHSGDLTDCEATTALAIHFPGVARVTIVAKAQEPAKLEADLARVNAQLQTTYARYGVQDEEGMLLLRQVWQAKERELLHAQAAVQNEAAPYANVGEIREVVAQLTRQLTECCNALGLTEQDAGSLQETSEDDLEEQYAAALREEQRVQSLLEGRQQQVDTALGQEMACAKQVERIEGDIRQGNAVMQMVLTNIHCRDAAELVALVATRAETLQQCRVNAADLEGQLPSPSEDPEHLLRTAREALTEIAHRERTLDAQRVRYQVEIENAQMEGRYERLADLEERLSGLIHTRTNLELEAQAIKLLRQIMLDRQREMVSGQLPELEEAIGRMLRAITGSMRPVALSSDFSVERILDERIAEGHTPDALSAGAREQLDLVVRIALGEAYARQYGPTMMVLDDALLYTDPARHDRIKEILKIAAQHLQIFILTSHPERYRGITPTACQFDLVQLASGLCEAVV